MQIAIVHDWLVVYGGAERVLEQILEVFPEADLYSLVEFIPPEQRGFLKGKAVQTSFIQKLPKAETAYRNYLPLFPIAIEQFDLSSYDLIISSSYAVAKGVITGPDQLHICMCYSPIRYAWDLQFQYLRESNLTRGLKSTLARGILHYIRQWDVRTANGVDEWISISKFIARRIQKVYRRDSVVIYPPVDIEGFTPQSQKEDFYLTASRMVPYKRIDLIVEAFSGMPERELIVIGEGPEFEKVKSKAGPNVKLLGYQPFSVLKDHMQRAKAFVFAAEEDFGIAPVEAQACGTPVVAYGKGGALETVTERTGLFFADQTVQSLQEAVRRFEKQTFDPAEIRKNAERFSAARFREEFSALANSAWAEFKARL